MAKRANKIYWFRTKKYGWGWGLPLTWQGWLSFGTFIAVWLWALFAFLPQEVESTDSNGLTTFILVLIADVLGLLYVSFKYGEPPKWSWGSSPTTSKKITRKANRKKKR